MSRFRTFIQRHLVADDPAPGYSRLDRLEGLGEPSAVPAVPAGGVAAAPARDRRYLLALVQQQRTRLAQVEELAEGLDRAGSRDRDYARLIRAALSLPGDDPGFRTPGT